MTRGDLEQAAHWHARLLEAPGGPSGDAVRAAFFAWLQMRCEHRAAYDAVERTDAMVRSSSETPQLRALGEAALSRLPAVRPRRRRAGAVAMVCAVCVAPVAAMTLKGWLPSSERPSPQVHQRTFRTGVGESRRISLAWGGQAELDTSSRLDIVDATLNVTGQAYVSAGQRPVKLAFGNGVVLTTAGDVNVHTRGHEVAILAERAPAAVRGAKEQQMNIEPGNVLVLRRGASRMSSTPDPGALTSWRDGWLTFDDVLLEEAAAEINRYQKDPVRLTAPGRGLRISGSFRTDDGAGFLKAVAHTISENERRDEGARQPSK